MSSSAYGHHLVARDHTRRVEQGTVGSGQKDVVGFWAVGSGR